MTLGPFLRGVYNVRIKGAENVPRFGPAIISPNHLSFIDPFFVALSIGRRMVFIGKAEYWDSWTTRWFFEMAGGIPVRREDPVRGTARPFPRAPRAQRKYVAPRSPPRPRR